MKAHHGFGAGLLCGVSFSTNVPLLIGLGIAVGFALANIGAMTRWIGRRFG